MNAIKDSCHVSCHVENVVCSRQGISRAVLAPPGPFPRLRARSVGSPSLLPQLLRYAIANFRLSIHSAAFFFFGVLFCSMRDTILCPLWTWIPWVRKSISVVFRWMHETGISITIVCGLDLRALDGRVILFD